MREASTDKLMSDLRAVLEDAEALLQATAGQAGDRIQVARDRAHFYGFKVGRDTYHCGGPYPSRLLLPVIPAG